MEDRNRWRNERFAEVSGESWERFLSCRGIKEAENDDEDVSGGMLIILILKNHSEDEGIKGS